MAWNVVIAGGGFGGAMAARELERIMPRQSARLVLVNDVNFMLYTPFLPEAAAGTLEPRHVVTPLREILKRTYLRLGEIDAHDPAARTVELRDRDGETEELPYDQLLLALGSVSRVLPVPGLAEHAVGFKTLADAIWLRNHVVETLEAANATEDPARRDELLTYVFVGGGYAGLEALAELQDFAADAIESYPRARLHGMRWVLVEAADRVLPEIDAGLAEYALRELRGRGIDIRLGTTLEEVTADSARLSSGETLPTRTVVWTAGVAPHPSLRAPQPAARRARPGPGRRAPAGARARTRSGRSATAPRRPTRAAASARRPPSTRSARARSRRATSPPSSASGRARPFEYRGNASFVNLGRYKAVGRIGGRTFRGFPAWWMARTYHMSQIPGAARKARAVIDWTASLPFRRDTSPRSARSATRRRWGDNGPWDSSTSSSPSSSA